MPSDYGANKEAVMLLVISAFRAFAPKRIGGVAGLPHRRFPDFRMGIFRDYFRLGATPVGPEK
jgi:hypothetical protein